MQSSYVEDVLMKTWQEAANIHITVADQIIQAFKDSGRQVHVTRDYLLTDQDFEDKDLIVSLGGDGTFLKTASMVKLRTMPILGVNTDPSRSVGHLTSIKIPYDDRNKEIPVLMDYIQKEHFNFIYKDRILLDKQDADTGKSIKKSYALNEIFIAERNVGTSSIYRLNADDKFVGKFKSSGFLMCTGTGSTGWLQSAKRTTDGDVIAGLNRLGFSKECQDVVHGIALDLSLKTAFPLDRNELYYYVREP